jgi:hypothetical protein
MDVQSKQRCHSNGSNTTGDITGNTIGRATQTVVPPSTCSPTSSCNNNHDAANLF